MEIHYYYELGCDQLDIEKALKSALSKAGDRFILSSRRGDD